MKIKFKKLHEGAVLPSHAKQGDAGADLTATSKEIEIQGNVVYGTGLAVEIPEGYVGLLFPRSSISKTNLRLTNSVGVLDSGYRGEISFKFKNEYYGSLRSQDQLDYLNGNIGIGVDYNVGDRIGQLVIVPYINIESEWVDELSDTERGSGSYGSTGK